MEERVPELRDSVAVLWRRKLIIAVSVIALTVLSVWYSARQPNLYTASSRIVVRSLSPTGQTEGNAYHDVTPETQSEVIRSELIAERVGKAIDMDVPPAVLASAVSTRVVTEELVEVSATSRSPQLAARLANAFVQEYLDYRAEQAAADVAGTGRELKKRMDDLSSQIDKLDAEVVTLTTKAARLPKSQSQSPAQAGEAARTAAALERATEERNALIVSLSGVRSRYEDSRASAATASGGTLISRATVPLARSSPNPKRDGAVGFLLGLIVGVGLAFLRDHFDDRVRSVIDAAHASGVSVLASVPRSKHWRRRKEAFLATVREPGSFSSEAYRQLRQSLVARGLGDDLRKVMFTSGGPGAGKSSSVANLGVVCAQAGMRVVCVSADLRRPRLHAFFGMENGTGLSDVLSGAALVRSAVKPTGHPNLSVITSGSVPSNPSELLDGTRLDRIFSELRLMADVVLIDAPPLASGADAMVLAPQSEMTIVVMRQEMARADGTAAAVQELRQAGARQVAAVLTMSSETVHRRQIYYYEATAAPKANGNGNGHVAAHESADEPIVVPAVPRKKASKAVSQ